MFALLYSGAASLRDVDTDFDTGAVAIRQQITTIGYPPVTKDAIRSHRGVTGRSYAAIGAGSVSVVAGRPPPSAYGSIQRIHLLPHLGHIPVDQLRVHHVQAMFDAIGERNIEIDLARESDDPAIRASVRGVRTTGPATMHRIRTVLRKALNDAIRTERLIEFNPAAHVELPSGKRPKARVWTPAAVAHWKATGKRPSPVMVWTPNLAGEFLDYAEAHDIVLYPMFALILYRGLRRGEAVGLRDLDVDLDTGVFIIRQQITTIG